MSVQVRTRSWVILLLLPGFLIPPHTLPAQTRTPEVPVKVTTVDVRLDAESQFHGVVVNGQGARMPGEVVKLRRVGADAWSQERRTDAKGCFVFREVPAGTYQVETNQGVCLCRIWTHRAGPPAAADQLLFVNDNQVQRGQRPIREILYTDPLLMATIVAAAIAIPIAVNKSRDKESEGS